jgi:predicted DNA-binding transcriptional regulator AlpA
MEQVFFNVPLAKLKPIFKGWVNETLQEALLLQKAKPQPEIETPIKLDEVVSITGLSKPTLYGYVQRNEIPYHKKGNRLYFFKTEIIDWIKTGKQKTLNEIEADADAFLSNKNKGLK